MGKGSFDYAKYTKDECPYPIRDDLPSAYREVWSHLAKPGAWWTGAERVAIADAVRRARNCGFCAERKEALSPYSVEGIHGASPGLSESAVDAVHRIVTDQSRLSRDWVEKLAATGVSDGHYVELLGVVVLMLSIDEFHRVLGLPLEPLPTAEAGVPSRYRPGGLEDGVGWVPMIHPAKAEKAEADLFPARRAGNVMRALSLVPDVFRMIKRLGAAQYVPFEFVVVPSYSGDRALNRAQMELVAGRVSVLNECFY